MTGLFYREQVYRLDAEAIKHDRIIGRNLMQRAATAVWQNIAKRWPEATRMVVFAGSGNNGGDAFAIANIARSNGLQVDLFMLGDLSRQSAESAFYRDQWLAGNDQIQSWSGQCPDTDIIVDGLLGIGIDKPLNEQWQTLIRVINQQPAARVSIDIPSGLDANRGVALPAAVDADLTVSFIARKLGCYCADGPDYCGERVFADLGVSTAVQASEVPVCHALEAAELQLPEARRHNSYKNHFGHVLVVGGNRGMSGAVRLAALAAMRSGAGLVSACVHADNYSAVAAAEAEIMVNDWSCLDSMLERASTLVVGPGLGRDSAAEGVLHQLQNCTLPMVVDADALHADFLDGLAAGHRVITPHPGEAGRLLHSSAAEVQQDRMACLERMQKRWPATCVLKGAGTLVGQPEHSHHICLRGNPGLATAGSGDVLSGIIAGLLAQGLSPFTAASSGVYLHAYCAEHAVQDQAQESLLATDLVNQIGPVLLTLRASNNTDNGTD